MLQADLPWSALPSLRVSAILDRLLVVSKENRKLEGVCLKGKKIFLQGYPKQNIVRRCIPIKTQGAQARYPSSVRHRPWGFFHFFLQHGPQITSYNHLGISS